ncbi:MAG: FAD-linked oxidase C-terminal domain-containing protein [Cryobacterium sp.]
MNDTGILAILRALLPAGTITTADAAVLDRSIDASGAPAIGAALALVQPRSTDQVAAVVGAANAAGVPVVPQGALTGLAGGANAVPGALLLDLSALNRILHIDVEERLAVVQPGVTVAELAAAASAVGLFYAPDPASAEWATIGGTIATNAGGMRCIKYGVTRDAVRSLEVVLADGSIVRTRPSTIKGVAGLDLTGLIVGSEGTLAVVTEATLSLLPAPGPSRGVSAVFPTVAAGIAASNAIAAGPNVPSTLELLDDIVLGAVDAYLPDAGIPTGAKAWVLAITDTKTGADADLAAFEAIFRQHGALTVDRADTPADLDRLLVARRVFNQAMRALLGGSLNGDISVPRSRLLSVVERFADLSDELGVVIAVGGHAGDGNLHPVVAFDPDDPEQVAAAHEAYQRISGIAQQLGGTMTGEHGVGVEKLAALDGELPPRLREVQRAIKAVLDPNGILNPGKKY